MVGADRSKNTLQGVPTKKGVDLKTRHSRIALGVPLVLVSLRVALRATDARMDVHGVHNVHNDSDQAVALGFLINGRMTSGP